MSGYLGTKAVLLSTTTASVGGDSTVGGDLTVDTNTLYVDSTNNNVGIGTSSPTNFSGYTTLDVYNATNGGAILARGSSVEARFVADDPTGTVQVKAQSSHPLTFATGGTERLRILSSGGLTFNGDTAAANALDDYEEGTFTPTYDTSNNNASGVTYGAGTTGSYIKIGRLVCFQITVHITTLTSKGTGSPQIRGLPYTTSATDPTNNGTRFTISTFSVDFEGGAGQTVHAYTPTTNVSYMQFLTTNDNGVWSVNDETAFSVQSGSYIIINGSYFTN